MTNQGPYADPSLVDIRTPIMVNPDRKPFNDDPFGYSALAWHNWGIELTKAGFAVDPHGFPTSRDLKNPILWLSHASALSVAALTLTRTVPTWAHMPVTARNMCDSQFCAVSLMLIGYSLEVCLKAMSLILLGDVAYESKEDQFKHHKLVELAKLVPSLTPKDKVILKLLTHFTMWAGRYPDPGSKYVADTKQIFELSNREQITFGEVLTLAAKIMKHAQVLADASPASPLGSNV